MASKRALRRKSCTGKRRHESADAGLDHIGRLHRTKGYQGRMDVYHCAFCRFFHIGHSRGRR